MPHRGQPPRATSEVAAELLRREAAPASVGDVLDGYAENSGLAAKLKGSWAVARAWHAVNGETERQATCGVAEDARQRRRVLVVYVDTRGHMIDFGANAELYRDRMARAGHVFDEVRFRLSRRPAKKA